MANRYLVTLEYSNSHSNFEFEGKIKRVAVLTNLVADGFNVGHFVVEVVVGEDVAGQDGDHGPEGRKRPEKNGLDHSNKVSRQN